MISFIGSGFRRTHQSSSKLKDNAGWTLGHLDSWRHAGRNATKKAIAATIPNHKSCTEDSEEKVSNVAMSTTHWEVAGLRFKDLGSNQHRGESTMTIIRPGMNIRVRGQAPLLVPVINRRVVSRVSGHFNQLGSNFKTTAKQTSQGCWCTINQ